MKFFTIFCLCLFAWNAQAQHQIQPTSSFLVKGEVVNEKTIHLSDLLSMTSTSLEDLVITNHLGVVRDTLVRPEGILLKEVLLQVILKETNPKLFSEFYFSLIAIDGYKVVYSWNELFNSPVGEHTFLVTSINDESMANSDDSILVITPIDFKTGRRHVKALSEIKVSRID